MNKHLLLHGKFGPVSVQRDNYGIPHVRAEAAADAWVGMGYAWAQDRMFQLDYDCRRAFGRWAALGAPSPHGRRDARPQRGRALTGPPDGGRKRVVSDALADVTHHVAFLAEAEP